nr:hypothetical protein Itr_chr12CG14820 [Ipomoea trifida]
MDLKEPSEECQKHHSKKPRPVTKINIQKSSPSQHPRHRRAPPRHLKGKIEIQRSPEHATAAAVRSLLLDGGEDAGRRKTQVSHCHRPFVTSSHRRCCLRRERERTGGLRSGRHRHVLRHPQPLEATAWLPHRRSALPLPPLPA